MKNENELKIRVEIPKGSSNKYEYNEKTQQWELDRVLSVAMYYPEEYGSIPKTLAEDNDPLDVICITIHPVNFPCLVPIRILGLLKMIDGGEIDDKIIAVNAVEPRLNNIQKITDLSIEKRNEIINFFRRYKELEGKKVEVEDEIKGKGYAENKIWECQERFIAKKLANSCCGEKMSLEKLDEKLLEVNKIRLKQSCSKCKKNIFLYEKLC